MRDILDDYKEHIPAQAIRALFRAIDYDETALAEVVLTYLRDNFYASETEPQGNTLRDKLTSTDWRHLVWWERQTTPPSSAAPTPVATPVATGSVSPASPGTSVAAPKSTGLRDMVVALLIAGGLIAFVIFLIKSGNSSPADNQPVVEQVEAGADRERTQPEEQTNRRTKKKRRAGSRPDESAQAETRTAEPKSTPSATPSPREEPYDKLLSDVGQYGERPAKKNGQWGLWRKGRWLVLPVYDEIDVYKNGRARVTTKGNTYEIDRNGDRVR